MSKEALKRYIDKAKAEDIQNLKNVRDTGLDIMVVEIPSFTESDKTDFITIINNKIIELGGEI
jgi:hypothetical protein